MRTLRIIDVVSSIETFTDDLTIFAVKPWTCDSMAIVAYEPDAGGLPPEVSAYKASYFLEVFIAKEFLSGYRDNAGKPTEDRERCLRLIEYAINDA